MPVTTIDGHEIHVDDEGFMTVYDEWDETLGKALAVAIGVEMTDDAWGAVSALYRDRPGGPAGDLETSDLAVTAGLAKRDDDGVGGPPDMKRNMTRLARGAKCVVCGARGFVMRDV